MNASLCVIVFCWVIFNVLFLRVLFSKSCFNIDELGISSFDLLSNVAFSVNNVFDKLSSLRGVRSIGPDGLSGDFLFHLRSVISYLLWLLFRRSLDDGIFPSIIKFSSVTPILKSGDPSSVLNYRPISIQSHISKILESLVLNDIRRSINPIIIEEQHGFRPGQSTFTCNLVLNNFIYNSFQQRSQVDVIYTNFHKAFDSVNHDVLVQILKASGFGEPL